MEIIRSSVFISIGFDESTQTIKPYVMFSRTFGSSYVLMSVPTYTSFDKKDFKNRKAAEVLDK